MTETTNTVATECMENVLALVLTILDENIDPSEALRRMGLGV